eukprot:scaffold9689_cov116-Isochrysis_galbana.AAC.3
MAPAPLAWKEARSFHSTKRTEVRMQGNNRVKIVAYLRPMHNRNAHQLFAWIKEAPDIKTHNASVTKPALRPASKHQALVAVLLFFGRAQMTCTWRGATG